MTNIDTLITVVSWEDRFIKGLQLNVAKYKIKTAVFFEFRGYKARNENNWAQAKKLCRLHKIAVIEKKLDFFDPKLNWNTIRQAIASESSSKDVLLDISTMPRETIWTILFFLDQIKSSKRFIYYRPQQYNPEWLSRDPGEPRLLYKMSGISQIAKPTMLCIFTGYDYQRITNIINHFEPQKLIVAHHNDSKGNDIAMKSIKEFGGNILTEELRFESQGDYNSFEKISEIVEANLNDFNIVFSSLGPKSSAIPLFQINRRYPETALCYIPCKEFNEKYSEGIQESNYLTSEIVIPKRKYNLVVD